MNAAERAQLAALIEALQGRAKNPTLSTSELVEVIGYLKGYFVLLERLSGNWKAGKK